MKTEHSFPVMHYVQQVVTCHAVEPTIVPLVMFFGCCHGDGKKGLCGVLDLADWVDVNPHHRIMWSDGPWPSAGAHLRRSMACVWRLTCDSSSSMAV